MTFLPPVVMEIRANAAQFLSEQNKVIASAKATATATEAAAQKEAAAARTAAAAAKTAADQQVAAADVSAKAAQAASDKRVLAETRATEAQKAAAKIQADSLGVMTEAQAAAYDTQIAKANAAASAAELAAAREAQANDKAAASATAAATAQAKAADAQVIASEKSAAAAEVGSTRTATAMGSITGIANKVSAATLLIGAGVAFVATDMAAKFEKSTMLLVTAGGEAKGQLDNVRQGILQISTQTGTSAEQMSEGMYIMEKAGYRGAAGLAALKASAQGAKDENVDLATMAQATTDVLLDYGYKMDTAAQATDSSVRVTNMLVAASGAAKTTMTDFANSMSAVVPIASTAKISFDQVGGAIATMTQHGQSAQESSQNLANLIQSLVRPNNMASAAMAQMGISTTDLAQHLGDRGLSGSLKLVSDAILKHMGPDGMVLQQTMKDNANATSAMQTIIAQMPPSLAKLSQGLQDGSVTIGEYTKAYKGFGGSAGALGAQLLTLYKANSGVNDSLKAGRPAVETYNAAMRDLFGNVTAARAATMLLMNDSKEFDANIKAIGDAGKKTGADIATWADMQSTLTVQMDQTKQMVSNLGIEIGMKLIPAAKAGLSGFTDLFHGFEQGNPLLLAAAGVIGGALAISVVNLGMKMATAGIKTVTTLVEMGTAAVTQSGLFIGGMLADEVAVSEFSTKAEIAGAKVKASLTNMTGGVGALGVAGVAVAAGMAVMAAGTEHAKTDLDQLTKALADFASGTAAGTAEIDQQFSKWDTVFGGATSSAHGLNDAIKYISQQSGFANGVNSAVDGLAAAFGQAKSETGQTLDKLKDVGTQLGQMVKGGSVDTAAKAFDQLALTFTKNGKSAQDALNTMPAYEQALKDSADAVGVRLSQEQLLEYAMGKVPDTMLNAMSATQKYTDAAGQVKPITPELQKSLDAAGVSADGLVTNVDKILPAMEAAGLATVSARDATSAFNKAIDDANGAVASLVKGGADMSHALNDNASDFNLTTDAGRQLNSQYENVLTAGEAMAKQAAGDGVNAQADVQKALQGTYDNLVNSGHQMGITGGKADDLARSVMGIPPGVDIKTWMDQTARDEAAKTKGALDAIPKTVSVSIDVTTNADGAINDYANAVQHARNIGGHAAVATGGYITGGTVAMRAFATGGMVGGHPGGGLLSGPGTGTSDSMLARVSNGEFIMRAAAVQKYGPGFMSALNKGTLAPSAGYVGAMGSASPSSTINHGGASHQTVQNINVQVAQTNATGQQIARDIGYTLLLQS